MDKEIKKKILEGLGEVQKVKPADVRRELFKISKRLPDIFHLRNIVFFSILFSFVILILFGQRFTALADYYPEKAINGGSYSEGVVGDIAKINPLFSSINPAEEDLSKLIFSGLTKVGENGQIKPDLAESYSVSSDGLVYDFKIKKGVKWHDKTELKADDVLFTINVIQNPDTRSTLFNSWKGVRVEKVDDYNLKIILDKPLNSFIYATTSGIVPKHILEKDPAQNLKVTEFNETPIGTGAFSFVRMDKKKEYTEVSLAAFKDYYNGKPHLDKMKIRSYKDENSLLEGYIKREIQGVSRISYENLEKAKKIKGIKIYSRNLPEYTALFYNQKNDLLKDKNLRTALGGAINKNDLQKIFNNEILEVSGAVMPGSTGRLKEKTQNISTQEAANILDSAGYKLEGAFRKKDGKELAITVTTLDTMEYLIVGEYLKKKWSEIGVNVKLAAKDFVDLEQNFIRPRNYDVLLFAENLGPGNDIYPFWHSSGKNDPGLNLSYFGDNKLDKYLELARETTDQKKNEEMLLKAQEILKEEKPATFLYSPIYAYGVTGAMRGVNISKIKEPKDRFSNIEKWYLIER